MISKVISKVLEHSPWVSGPSYNPLIQNRVTVWGSKAHSILEFSPYSCVCFQFGYRNLKTGSEEELNSLAPSIPNTYYPYNTISSIENDYEVTLQQFLLQLK